jgi:thiamine-phosphate pyrophosphorylase
VTTLAEVANQLNSRQARTAGKKRPLPPLLLMSDAARLPDPCAAAARLPAGSGVILRHYDDPARDALARALADIARQRALVLLIGRDSALAERVGAAGVHLPESELGWVARVRRRPSWLVTVAAHSLAALNKAERAGADAALLSPVFETASHPGARTLGPYQFATLSRRAKLPVYALGGINEINAALLLGSAAIGIAAIGALLPRG